VEAARLRKTATWQVVDGITRDRSHVNVVFRLVQQTGPVSSHLADGSATLPAALGYAPV
jgi:hypothetical protein